MGHLDQFYEDLEDLRELTHKTDVLFIFGDWNAKVESQEIPGVTGNSGLGEQNEARQRLKQCRQENAMRPGGLIFWSHISSSFCIVHEVLMADLVGCFVILSSRGDQPSSQCSDGATDSVPGAHS